MENPGVYIAKWRDISPQVAESDTVLAKAIDKIPASKGMKVVIAEYPFGCPIVENGEFFLHYKGKVTPLTAAALPKNILQLLDYPWESMPIGIPLENTVESIIETPTHTIPLKCYQPGMIFPLHPIFKRFPTVIQGAYRYFSGCRSLFMLSKLSDAQYNKRLSKAYQLTKNYCPKQYGEQWQLFKALAESKYFASNWRTKMVFLPRTFFEELHSGTGNALALRHQLLEQAWQRTFVSQYQGMYELAWSLFVDKLKAPLNRSLTLLETAKTIIKIAMRISPGFTPCTDDSHGPITALTKAFMEVYRLRYHYPIFMQTNYFSGTEPVYYSLQRPILAHALPEKTTTKRTIKEMQYLYDILHAFQDSVLKEHFPFSLSGSLLSETMRNVEFELFHPQGKGTINTDIRTLFDADARFDTVINAIKTEKKLSHPESSLFFHGCIRIQNKQNVDRKPSMRDFLIPLRKKGLSN